jgi:hypothetical protein
MATQDDIVAALEPEDAVHEAGKTSVQTRFESMLDLLMCGDYEQHLTVIATGSSSTIYTSTCRMQGVPCLDRALIGR